MRAQLWYLICGEWWGEGMHSGRGKPRWTRGWTDSATLHASITTAHTITAHHHITLSYTLRTMDLIVSL